MRIDTATSLQPLSRFREDVLRGLRQRPRSLPCKYFYDKAGSLLFDRICELPEYYLTRAETALIETHLDAIAAACGPRALLIEFGSGSAYKTQLLLDRMPELARYVPVDISAQHLFDTADRLRARYPRLSIAPVVGDYAGELPAAEAFATGKGTGRRVVFFPGSSIGNFEPADAVGLLRRMRRLAGPGGVLLVGTDLGSDEDALIAAYDDAAGVTAAFNLNLLARINRELCGGFALQRFRHRAVWQRAERRIEMQIVSTVSQRVQIAGEPFSFEQNEAIVTEHCYKYRAEDFARLAHQAGLEPARMWTDPSGRMGMHELRVPSAFD